MQTKKRTNKHKHKQTYKRMYYKQMYKQTNKQLSNTNNQSKVKINIHTNKRKSSCITNKGTKNYKERTNKHTNEKTY